MTALSTSESHPAGFASVGIVGFGLIGASLAAALKRLPVPPRVVGVDRQPATVAAALERGLMDGSADDAGDLIGQCDVIVLAVPVLSLEHVLASIRRSGRDAMPIVTDVGSVKGVLAVAARQVFGGLPAWLIPGHPIAGSEFSGIDAADPELFQRHQVILTPHEANEEGQIAHLETLWEAVGATVERLSIERHDEVLAATSHLPHLLAFTLVDSLARESESYEIFHYAAGGFRDFTRIAASDPLMWHDVFLANDRATLAVLDRFREHLDEVRDQLARRDGQALHEVFVRAKHARDYFSTVLEERAQDEPPESDNQGLKHHAEQDTGHHR